MIAPRVIRNITRAVVLILALSASPALASTHVWTGAVNPSWSVAGNWSGGVPASGESGGTIITLPGGTGSVMDISGLVVDQINFLGSGNTITGTTPLGVNGALLNPDINDLSGGNTITVPIALTGATSVQANVNAGQLTIAAVISGSTGLIKTGPGTLFLNPTGNTYAGATDVQRGALAVKATIGVAIPGTLTIGTGAGAAGSATVRDVLFGANIAPTSNVTVNADGVLDISNGNELENVAGLTVNGGSVALGTLRLRLNGPLAMDAGTISGSGTVGLGGDPTQRSSMTPSATIGGPVVLAAGTLVANGQVTGAVTVAAQTTLTGDGVLGPVTVAGALIPQVGMRTGALSFTAGGSFNFAIPSTDPTTTPTVISTGPVAIDPAAVLTVTAAPGLTVPGGAIFPVISNIGTGTTTGTFAGAPFTTAEGVPVTPSDAGGDGNDLVLTAANVAPVVGSITAAPTSAPIGQAVTFSVSPSDANRDRVTTTWDFGDGTSATGSSTSHAYATAGTYNVVATASDGAAQAQASMPITVPSPPAFTAPAFTSLAVRSKQTGTRITGSLSVATAGSTLKLTLQIPAASAASSKSSKKPVTIGTATVKKPKSGKQTFTVKLDSSHGLKAQKKHKTLKVTLSVSVTPPGGSATTATRAVTLTRAAVKKKHR